MSAKIGGLGKGLDLIFEENSMSVSNENSNMFLKISEIKPNKNQPRTNFEEESLKELAESIMKHGVIQPLVVKPTIDGYRIIAGERRYRASKMAGVTEVPVIIKDLDDTQIMEVALVENLQREDLSPIEEAKGYKSLSEVYNMTQEEISRSVGKSRPYIANSLRLLNLPNFILEKLENEQISSGHARALLSIKDENDLKKALEITIKQGLNVRQLEQLIKKLNFKEIEEIKSIKVLKKDSFFDKISENFEDKWGHKVRIVAGRNKKGSVQIEFKGEEDLLELYQKIFGEKYKE